MKIVLVLHFKLDRNAGAAGVVLTLGDAFRAAGHQVDTVSHDALGAMPLLLRNFVFPIYVAFKLLLAYGDADVIEGGTGDCWIYYLLRRSYRRTLFVTFSQGLYRPLHERLMRERERGKASVSWRYWLFHGSLELWQEAASMQLADLVYVLNADERRYVTDKLRVPAARVTTVRNGLADHFCRRCAQIQATESEADRPFPAREGVVQVGSYEERKGIRSSVAATTRLLTDHSHLRMAYLGTTHPPEMTLKDYPAILHDRITALSRFDNADLPRLLSEYQIFIMPSTYEGFGIAPLEAMACGVVPIVTDIAGPAEYVSHGSNGLVVPVDDPAALEQAIMALIEDDELYARLRAGALQTAARFGWDEVAATRLSDYERLGDAKRRRVNAGDRPTSADQPLTVDAGPHGAAEDGPRRLQRDASRRGG